MKYICSLLAAALLGGCATHPKGTTHYDQYDSIKVDQMVGNNVSRAVLQKVLVCLNARRETRRVTALTNVIVAAVTNSTVIPSTNITISTATNYLFTSMTNIAPATPGVAAAASTEAAAVAAAVADTTPPLALTNPGPSFSTNVTVSLASNMSASKAPNQTAANAQQVRTFNNQITTTSNNVSVSLLTNLIVTVETNQVISYATNYVISSLTNTVVTSTNGLAHDYFLYAEMTPPADFTLASGESLILLVDGMRYGFAPASSGTAFVGRKGFTSNLYRVPPEVLVAIANSKEVKLRFKGTSSVIERTMSNRSRKNFKTFLLKYFIPEPPGLKPKAKAAFVTEPTRIATR